MIFAIATRAISLLELFIFAWALLSWFHPDPGNPIVRVIHVVVDPIMKPFTTLIPPVGGVSFAGIIAILVLEFVKSIFARAAGMGVP